MSKRPAGSRPADRAAPPAPDGAGRDGRPEGEIPCRSANRPVWKYALLAAVFLAWFAFLIWVAVS